MAYKQVSLIIIVFVKQENVLFFLLKSRVAGIKIKCQLRLRFIATVGHTPPALCVGDSSRLCQLATVMNNVCIVVVKAKI